MPTSGKDDDDDRDEEQDEEQNEEGEEQENQEDNGSELYGPENDWYYANVSDVPEEGDCGFKEGDRACNMNFVDQNGDSRAISVCWKIVVLDVSANWCGPCQQAAASGEGSHFNEMYGDDAIFIGVMADGSSGIPSVSEFSGLGISVWYRLSSGFRYQWRSSYICYCWFPNICCSGS